MAHTYTNRADNRSPTWLNDAGFIALCLFDVLGEIYVRPCSTHTNILSSPLPRLILRICFFCVPHSILQKRNTYAHKHQFRWLPLLLTYMLFSCIITYHIDADTNERKREIHTHTHNCFVRSFVCVSNLISAFISLTHHHFHFNFR